MEVKKTCARQEHQDGRCGGCSSSSFITILVSSVEIQRMLPTDETGKASRVALGIGYGRSRGANRRRAETTALEVDEAPIPRPAIATEEEGSQINRRTP